MFNKILLLLLFSIMLCIVTKSTAQEKKQYRKKYKFPADSVLFYFLPTINEIDTLYFEGKSNKEPIVMKVGRLFGGQTKFAIIEYHYKVETKTYPFPIYSTALYVYKYQEQKWQMFIHQTIKEYAVYGHSYSQLIDFNGDGYLDLLKTTGCRMNGATGCENKLWLYNSDKDNLQFVPKFSEIVNPIYDKTTNLIYSDYTIGSSARSFYIYEWIDNQLFIKQDWLQWGEVKPLGKRKKEYDMETNRYEKGRKTSSELSLTKDKNYFPKYLPKFFRQEYEKREMQLYGN